MRKSNSALSTILLLASIVYAQPRGSSEGAVSFHEYVEERTSTTACDAQSEIQCDTLLFIEHEASSPVYSLSVGYLIYSVVDTDVLISNRTQTRISRTSVRTASLSAGRLVSSLRRRYSHLMCDIRPGQVANVLLQSTRLAATCRSSEQPSCFPFLKIAVCTLPWTTF